MVAAKALMLILTSITGANDAQLLCFGASWCQPCQQMKPTFEQLEREGYPLRRIDVDQYADLAKRYEVKAVPSLVLIDGRGQIIDRIDQATSLDTLRAMYKHYRVAAVPPTVRGQSPPPEPKRSIRVADSRATRQSPEFAGVSG